MSEGKQGMLKSPTKIARVIATPKASGSASSAASTANSNSTSSLLSALTASGPLAAMPEPIGSGGTAGEDDFKLNDRVLLNGKPAVVAFIGEIESKEGVWIGVVLDEAGEGKNNGSINGVAYFTTDENRGVFCRAAKLTKVADVPAKALQASLPAPPATPQTPQIPDAR
jgi:hypothetical protein